MKVDGIVKAYRQAGREVAALRGVDLDLQGPTFEALMGPSGSGKSTLLSLLAGLDRPDQGQILLGGRDIASLGEHERTRFRRRQVGIVFQQFNLLPTLSARQNIALPGVLESSERRWLDKRVDELLELMGLTDRANHRPAAMSGGEQQRTAIARAMLFSPELILADEPTGNLDSATAESIWHTLASLTQQQNATVLMVTHEAAAVAHCRRAHVLLDGTIAGTFEVNNRDASGVASCYYQLVRPKGA